MIKLKKQISKKKGKGETTNESQQQASENIAHIETQEANKPTEHVENVVHLPKKKNVVESVPL